MINRLVLSNMFMQFNLYIHKSIGNQKKFLYSNIIIKVVNEID